MSSPCWANADLRAPILGWQPRWPFATTVDRTVAWYRAVHEGASPLECCLADLKAYNRLQAQPGLSHAD